MGIKKYLIKRHAVGMVECKVNAGQDDYWLRHLGGHSEGFEFGFNGSGPSDLAYSLLADILGEANNKAQSVETLSHKLHTLFRSEVLARIPSKQNEVEYTEEFLIYWISVKIKTERGSLQTYRSERDRAANAQEKMTKLQEDYSEGRLEATIERQVSRENFRLRKIIENYEKFINNIYIKE